MARKTICWLDVFELVVSSQYKFLNISLSFPLYVAYSSTFALEGLEQGDMFCGRETQKVRADFLLQALEVRYSKIRQRRETWCRAL